MLVMGDRGGLVAFGVCGLGVGAGLTVAGIIAMNTLSKADEAADNMAVPSMPPAPPMSPPEPPTPPPPSPPPPASRRFLTQLEDHDNDSDAVEHVIAKPKVYVPAASAAPLR